MHFVYILYSQKLNRYYIGETHDVSLRLERHNSDYYDNKWTAKGKPWTLILVMSCLNRSHAISVEKHIKRMKSKVYIQNLLKYEEMRLKLIEKYSSTPDC